MSELPLLGAALLVSFLMSAVAMRRSWAGDRRFVGLMFARWSFLGMTTTTEGEFLVTHDERYRCLDQMSDPRVSGTMEGVISTRKRNPLASFAGTVVLSSDGGTWLGTAWGAITYRDGQPTNYTVAVYSWEGAYAGLAYTVLGTGSNEGLVQAGWIEPAK